jgi:hypothetical protein
MEENLNRDSQSPGIPDYEARMLTTKLKIWRVFSSCIKHYPEWECSEIKSEMKQSWPITN